MSHPHMISRPMLACADGSFLPLIAKYDSVTHAQVFELDANLCRDVQLVVRREVSPPKVHAAPAMTPGSQVIGNGGGDRGICGYGGGLNEQGQPMDYQARINAIVAENRQREQTASMHSTPIPPAQHARTSSNTITSTPSDPNDGKEYCTYWIRTGECDYVQQGCRYKHEMPSLEKLKYIGFTKGFPRWWQEKVQYARPAVVMGAGGTGGGTERARMKHDGGAFRRMVDAHLAKHGEKPREGSNAGSGSSTASGSGSESDASVRVAVPAVRSRVVTVQAKSAAKPEPPPPAQKVITQAQPTFQSPTTSPTVALTKPVTVLTKPKPQQPADLLDLIGDSESDSLQPALKAPQNSPESQPVLRQGHFVPHNDPVSTSVSMTPPPRTILRSPSPLLLETCTTTVDNRPTDAKKLANMVAGLAPKLLPVGYQGTEHCSAKQPTEQDPKVLPATKTKINRIEELEAELVKLKPSSRMRTELTKGDTGLAKSRYATRAEKVVTPPSPNGRTRRRHRAVRSPPLPTKKVVSAKALRGLQESRERDERQKAREIASEKKVEQAIKPIVAEVKTATLPGYKYLFAETE